MHNLRKLVIALITPVLLAAPAIQAKPRLAPDQELAKLLVGRVAGKPVNCLSQWQTRDLRIINGTALVYGEGQTLWVNHPINADQLDDDDILVTRTSGLGLCDLDIVHTVDRTGLFSTGFISLGRFVPYHRKVQVN